jgi:5'-deoxynucleotidase YfbR-like HD superfamily hydrolase
MRRAGNVKRFHTHSVIGENTVAHHSWGVAILLLELIEKPSLDMMRACIYHDAFEVVTGDIPWTAKQRNPTIKHVADNMEADVALEIDVMWNLMPWEEHSIKFCDMLDLMWFCVSQRKLGSANMDEVFENGRRFLMGHCQEFKEYEELSGSVLETANAMYNEVCHDFYSI